MDFDFSVKLMTEFFGTALLLILGNGAVANVELKGTKGHQSGWLVIAIGYGMGVMIPALMFGNVSGNHINPAFTLGLAVSGLFPWANVLPYIVAQLLGAMFGQLVVVACHRPYYHQTENPTTSWEHSQRFLVWIKELLKHVRLLPSMALSTSLLDHSCFSLRHLD